MTAKAKLMKGSIGFTYTDGKGISYDRKVRADRFVYDIEIDQSNPIGGMLFINIEPFRVFDRIIDLIIIYN